MIRKREQGFALAAILWLLAGLTILVVSVSGSLLAVSRTNRDSTDRLQLLLAEQQVSADLVFLSQTYKTLGAGVMVGPKVLQLDGSTRYTLEDGTSVVLQDLQGLVGLNSPNTDNLKRLLTLCGAEPQQVDSLGDALLDYEDADSLKRLNGAEAREYAALGLPAPRDQPLADVQELWQVFGWPKVQASWKRQHCGDWVSIAPSTLLNLWTAPASVLRAVGISAEEAAVAVADRDQNRELQLLSPYLLAWRSMNDGVGLGGSRFAVRSSGKIRVTISREGAGLNRQFVLERGSINNVVPFLRSQFDWVPVESIVPPEDAKSKVPRFTDNLATFFFLTPGVTNATDAQISMFPVVHP